MKLDRLRSKFCLCLVLVLFAGCAGERPPRARIHGPLEARAQNLLAALPAASALTLVWTMSLLAITVYLIVPLRSHARHGGHRKASRKARRPKAGR